MLPVTLKVIEDGVFASSTGLRYADFLMCDSTDIVFGLRDKGFTRLGIDTLKTLVYVPAKYGTVEGKVNVVVANAANSMEADVFRLVADKDYCVPYAFVASSVENSRTLTNGVPVTACLPYDISKLPTGIKAYSLEDRDGNIAVFRETQAMNALQPYIVLSSLEENGGHLNTSNSCDIPASAKTFGEQVQIAGFTLRGTLSAIGNKEANDIGAYVLNASEEWEVVPSNDEASLIQPFTAFMLIPSGSGTYGTRLENKDIATAIDTVKVIDEDGTESYFDLNGRQLSGKPAKGIYISPATGNAQGTKKARKVIVK